MRHTGRHKGYILSYESKEFINEGKTEKVPISRDSHGKLRMNRRSSMEHVRRKPGEKMKVKEKKCWTCGSIPDRVLPVHQSDCGAYPYETYTGVCEDCGLRFEPEGPLEVPFNGLSSSQGIFENEF